MACAACGCATCGCGGGAAVMTYVGAGGAYVAETNYKYVGPGGGEFDLVRPRSFTCCIVSGFGVLALLLVILLIIFIPTTTMPCPPSPKGECTLWGDPHVNTFDGQLANFYREGEFWVVNAGDILVQGKYRATPYTHGLSATRAIAIGGKFVAGNTIIIPALDDGPITVNGVPVCTDFPSSYILPGDVAEIRYDSHGHFVDAANSHIEKHIVHVHLPAGVYIQVMRYGNYINVRVIMHQVKDQFGHCGNFNMAKGDDSSAAIRQCCSARGYPVCRVPQSECLFGSCMALPRGRHPKIEECPAAKRAHAKKVCGKENHAIGGKLELACEFDVCFAGDAMAAADQIEASEVR